MLRNLFLLLVEIAGFSLLGLILTVVLLGHFGNRLSGTDLVQNLLPFAGIIVALGVSGSILLVVWMRLRQWFSKFSTFLPAILAILLPLLTVAIMPKPIANSGFIYFRTLVGGKEEAARTVIAHQVYAAYRRLETKPLAGMIKRAAPYDAVIEEASAAYGLDADLLKGLAATESSFLPRISNDGGKGLFQITSIPKNVVKEVDQRFAQKDRSNTNPRYNAFLGAATLRHYLTEINNDLFLGLLAYNIGPANGGLRFIMNQYGVTDFTTIQPYLAQLPRDYPIRVLANGLAFRIQRRNGHLLAYERGDNALTIQAMGIPGF